LFYLRARYYDPSTGQFISRDPAVASTREPYAYVADNPLNSTDPSGLCGIAMSIFFGTLCNAENDAANTHVHSHAGAALARQAAQTTEYLHEHLVAGSGACLIVCVGIQIQENQWQVSVGGAGLTPDERGMRGLAVGMIKPGYAGWASKRACDRAETTYGGAAGLGGFMGGASVGAHNHMFDPYSTSVNDPGVDESDTEVDVGLGRGAQAGFMTKAFGGSLPELP
jgi:hypothetical protein